MTCYYPQKTYAKVGGGITWKKSESNGNKMPIKCGGCIGCRIDHSREWAIRCYHEAKMHQVNCFITLTYAPDKLPMHGSLHMSHFQNFMKRLRKEFAPRKIRFYHCGEYGKKLDRPHYHALLFGHDFPDKKLWKIEKKTRLYRSETLEKLWPNGYSSIGSMSFQAAAYCARYTMKKLGGEPALSHYVSNSHIDTETGEIAIKPEYATMSRRPGIGKTWYDQYGKTDAHAHDYVVVNGREFPVPHYYDTLLAKRDPDLHAQIIERRQNRTRNNSDDKLKVREIVKKAQTSKLIRNYEEST